MDRYLGAGCLVFAVLASIGGEVQAGKTVIRSKGAQASGAFDRDEVLTCADGSTALRITTVQIAMFEGTTTTDGEDNTLLQASLGVSRFDGCTFQSFFDFGQFEGVGSLQVDALKTGRMTGLFTLEFGTLLDVDLTLTGSDETSMGTFMQRSIMGTVLVIQRSKGKTRTATLAGTVAVDGQTITSAQMLNTSGSIATNTGGETTFIEP